MDLLEGPSLSLIGSVLRRFPIPLGRLLTDCLLHGDAAWPLRANLIERREHA